MKPSRKLFVHVAATAALISHTVSAISIDLTSEASIKNASAIAAAGAMTYYNGYLPGNIPGNLIPPYYWWEAGAFNGLFMDYWYFTGDSQYNEIITQAMLFQTGPGNDYMPPNQTKTEGNDDQAFWGMAAITAAENNFPNPPDTSPQWLALAQAVFNTQAARWDTSTCAGGLKWQIFAFNTGYNLKNTISNGCFFNMASRLAVYTGNDSYAQWADKAWDWSRYVGLISPEYQVFDNTDDTLNCTQIDHIQWSYNAATVLLGAANMYNYTGGSAIWQERVQGLVNGLNIFFKNGIMTEVACEGVGGGVGTCNNDQRSFKAYLSRWMIAAAVRAPFIYNQVMPLIQSSAYAAAKSCNGGASGNECGLQWTTETCDGSLGVGEELSAMSVFMVNLVSLVAGPVTGHTGGTSKGNPSAGTGGGSSPTGGIEVNPLPNSDRIGAGILTVLIIFWFVGGAWWMIA